tara:strand:- start:27415 stop:28821 length:1407 start_codon:yes stop_codon:yes gene_type:complete
MYKKSIHISFFVLILMSALINEASYGQSRVTIIQAETAESGVFEGENIRKITGNVVLQTEDMVMRTDSVFQFLNRSLLMAFNAQIETENDVLWADTLYYDSGQEYSRLRGRVIIQSDKNTVFSESMDVDHISEQTFFNVPVRFEDEGGTLVAQSGLYYQALDSAIFRGNVQLADSTQYLEADSLFMNRSEELYELFGRVFAEDFEDNVMFAGNYLYADSTGYRLLEENAWLMEISESEADTTHLLANKIELREMEGQSSMDAHGMVRIWTPKFTAIADTVNYREDPDQFTLRSSPILWQNRMQLTGPFIEAVLEDDNIRFLESYPQPIIVMEDSVTARLHQMTGDTLQAYFNDGILDRIKVFDNTQSIFHNVDENDEPDGLIEMISIGPLEMYFTDGEIDSLVALRNIDGSYLPESPQNIDRQLDNFQWNPESRPLKPPTQSPRNPEVPFERPFDLPPRYLQYIESVE